MCNKVFKSNKLAIASMLALVIGLILGTSLRYAQEKSWTKRQVMYVKYIAGLIIQMLKGLTAPIIVPSIIVAVGSLKPNYVGKIGGRALGYYIITTVLAVIVGINLVLTYVGVQSWKAAHLPTLEIRVEQGGIVPVGFELYEVFGWHPSLSY